MGKKTAAAEEGCSLKKSLENQMIKVVKSWSEKQECWARGFLTWNREKEQVYGPFARELQAKAKEKGIDLIIDRDFDLELLDDQNHPDRFSHVYHVSFVLLSFDYVDSEKCMREILSMEKLNMRPHPIHFFTDDEIEQKPFMYYRFSEFLERANNTIGTKDDVAIHTILRKYFYGMSHEYEPVSVDLPLSQVMYNATMLYWFPHYNTFSALDTCAKQVYKYTTATDHDQQDRILYLGLVGSNDKYNKFIARNVCLPHRLSGFRVIRSDMLTYRGHFGPGPESEDMPYDNWFFWGLANVLLLLKIASTDHLYGEEDVVYKRLKDELPKGKCFVLIENIAFYAQLKALANLLDFLSPGSRILFTTTNESFFGNWSPTVTVDRPSPWQMESNSDGLPTLALCKGQMLHPDELKSLEEVTKKVAVHKRSNRNRKRKKVAVHKRSS